MTNFTFQVLYLSGKVHICATFLINSSLNIKIFFFVPHIQSFKMLKLRQETIHLTFQILNFSFTVLQVLLFLLEVVSLLVNCSVEVLSTINSSTDFKFECAQVWSQYFAVLAALLTLDVESLNLLEIFPITVSQSL
jgi:hypothetical protein